MKTSQAIRVEYAKENFGYTWHEAFELGLVHCEDFDSVMDIYAKQIAEKALKDAAENARTSCRLDKDFDEDWYVDKQSILNTPINLK